MAQPWAVVKDELLQELKAVGQADKAVLFAAQNILSSMKVRIFKDGQNADGQTFTPAPSTKKRKKGRFGDSNKLIFTETRELQNSLVAIPIPKGAGIAAEGSRGDLTNKELGDILDDDFGIFSLNKSEERQLDQSIQDFLNKIF